MACFEFGSSFSPHIWCSYFSACKVQIITLKNQRLEFCVGRAPLKLRLFHTAAESYLFGAHCRMGAKYLYVLVPQGAEASSAQSEPGVNLSSASPSLHMCSGKELQIGCVRNSESNGLWGKARLHRQDSQQWVEYQDEEFCFLFSFLYFILLLIISIIPEAKTLLTVSVFFLLYPAPTYPVFLRIRVDKN